MFADVKHWKCEKYVRKQKNKEILALYTVYIYQLNLWKQVRWGCVLRQQSQIEKSLGISSLKNWNEPSEEIFFWVSI